jgi:hypothetical protein
LDEIIDIQRPYYDRFRLGYNQMQTEKGSSSKVTEKEEKKSTYVEIVKVLGKKITKELDHLEYLEHRINSQQHLKKKNASEEKHHSEDLLHPGIKLFFLVYVILVTILVTKLQTVEPMQRT